VSIRYCAQCILSHRCWVRCVLSLRCCVRLGLVLCVVPLLYPDSRFAFWRLVSLMHRTLTRQAIIFDDDYLHFLSKFSDINASGLSCQNSSRRSYNLTQRAHAMTGLLVVASLLSSLPSPSNRVFPITSY